MKPTVYSNFVCVIVVSLFCAGCISSDKDVVFRDERVVIRNRPSFVLHNSGKRTLEVSGRTFSHLISASYVLIPEWNSIIFLTYRDGGAYILHIFSLEKKQDIAIKQDGSYIYVGSGLGRPKTDFLACYVEKVEGDTAVLVQRRYGGMDHAFEDTYQLDRSKKTVSHLQRREERRVDKPK